MKVTVGSDNIFKDLGFGAEEAAKLKARSDLMIEVRQLIERNDWTQAEAAERLGVTQPRISDLVRGRINLFSVDALIDMLAKGGQRVVVHVSENRTAYPAPVKAIAAVGGSRVAGGRGKAWSKLSSARTVVAQPKKLLKTIATRPAAKKAAARKPAAKK
ncbi:MAG: XRE family transcriptional regulator [Betaproteobacteria bacterium]|nr:XRE family transcriptional regulator [Betaproteobacteria bacterium]